MSGPRDAELQRLIEKVADDKLFGMDTVEFQAELGEVRSRLAALEEAKLPEQVNFLVGQLTRINEHIMSLRRTSAGISVRVELHHALRYIRDTIALDPSLAVAGTNCTSRMRESEATVQGRLTNSFDPEADSTGFDTSTHVIMTQFGFQSYLFPS